MGKEVLEEGIRCEIIIWEWEKINELGDFVRLLGGSVVHLRLMVMHF